MCEGYRSKFLYHDTIQLDDISSTLEEKEITSNTYLIDVYRGEQWSNMTNAIWSVLKGQLKMPLERSGIFNR
jgi:hypothetical protein